MSVEDILARHVGRHRCTGDRGKNTIYDEHGCDAHQLGVALEEAGTQHVALTRRIYDNNAAAEAREARLAFERRETMWMQREHAAIEREAQLRAALEEALDTVEEKFAHVMGWEATVIATEPLQAALATTPEATDG